MADIRHVSIKNFRGISSLEWYPNPGINAVIGTGDSCKTTVIEAIDLVIGARRATFTDTDFYDVDTKKPIIIDVTVGNLPRELLNLEIYLRFMRGFADAFPEVWDEPLDGTEPVLTLRLKVGEDCDPVWSLFSERVDPADLPRDMRPDHRSQVSAQRIGATVSQHLAWGPRSVLMRLSDTKGKLASVLANANRAARQEFTIDDAKELKPAIDAARSVAQTMAVAGAIDAEAALDARSVNVTNGAIALHNGKGVPLRALGLGSARLLAAGLQAAAAADTPILLMDEVEHGLEPHRIARMLHSLGSKSANPAQQVFLTTHSPIVLRELSSSQLWITKRRKDGSVTLSNLGNFPEAQGILRELPEAFLSPSVLVCEGATEVGICRGIDLYETDAARSSLALRGVALADGKGSSQWGRALGLATLGFRVGLFRDSDAPPPPDEAKFIAAGGVVFKWDQDYATEQQIFSSIPLDQIPALIIIAETHKTMSVISDNLGSAGYKKEDCERLKTSPLDGDRQALGLVAKKSAWFKRVDISEMVGREILGPNLDRCEGTLSTTMAALAAWIAEGNDADA